GVYFFTFKSVRFPDEASNF
ncbi:unnamed protein product, partial [Leptidea sinapis]